MQRNSDMFGGRTYTPRDPNMGGDPGMYQGGGGGGQRSDGHQRFYDYMMGVRNGNDPYFDNRMGIRTHENAPEFKGDAWGGWMRYLIGGGDPADFGSGGGGGGAATAGKPAYGASPVAKTIQPFFPGFQGMIAQQLAQGFGSGGGTPEQFSGALSDLYSPMTMFQFSEPISTTAALYGKGKYAPFNTGNAALDKLLSGGTVGAKNVDDTKKKGGR